MKSSEPTALGLIVCRHRDAGLFEPEVREVVERVSQQGIITEGPVTFPNGARSIFVRDPERNVVEVNQAAEN